MRILATVAVALIALMTACGPRENQQAEDGPGAPIDEQFERRGDPSELPPVAPELLAAANETFTPIEPSEIGVTAAPSVLEALAPLLGPESLEYGASLNLSIRESGDEVIADIVRANTPDEAIAAGHLRIEFRREPEGWFPTNAYRRTLCRRGPEPMQWTSGACP